MISCKGQFVKSLLSHNKIENNITRKTKKGGEVEVILFCNVKDVVL